MSLRKALEVHAPDEGLTAEVEYLPGFLLTVPYWTELRLDKELAASKESTFIKHRKTEQISGDAFRRRLAAGVQGWAGMTYRVLAQMGLVDLRKVAAEEGPEALGQEQPFDREDLFCLMKSQPSFEGWLLRQITDPANFPLQEEQKNLPSSSGGGATPGESPATSAPSSEES